MLPTSTPVRYRTRLLLPVARLAAGALLAAGLASTLLPAAPAWPLTAGLAAAFLAPLLWPRWFGTLPALLGLVAGSFLLAQLLARGVDPAASSAPPWALPAVALLFLGLAAAPLTYVLYMARRHSSAGVVLASLIALPLASIAFLVSAAASAATPAALSAMLPNLTWIPAVWFPSLGCCLGPVMLLISLGILLKREGDGESLAPAAPDAG